MTATDVALDGMMPDVEIGRSMIEYYGHRLPINGFTTLPLLVCWLLFRAARLAGAPPV